MPARPSPRGLSWIAPALLAFACDTYESEPEGTDLEARTLVGVVEGTDLAVGALLDDDSLVIYQCGGDETFDTHTRWFRGVIGEDDDPDGFELSSGDFTLVGIRTEDGLEGELVEADGTRHPFAVDPVADDADPGVYVADHDGLRTGVVVREQGGTLTAQGAACNPQLECSQVIILAPLDITDGSANVQVDVDDMPQDIVVERTLVAPSGV